MGMKIGFALVLLAISAVPAQSQPAEDIVALG